MTRIRIGLTVLIAALALTAAFAAPGRALDCTDTWSGGGGTRTFSTATNWTDGSAPGAGDVACIGAHVGDPVIVDNAATMLALRSDHPITVTGTLTVTQDGEPSSAPALRLQGTLAGAGDFTAGSLTWLPGARMSGDGRTVVTGAAAVNSGSGSGWDSVYLDGGRALETRGTTSWPIGGVNAARGTVWDNKGSLDVGFEWPGRLVDGGGAGTQPPRLNNQAGATITKATGTGRTEFQIPVHNAGTVRAQSGRLGLDGGGTGAATAVYAGAEDDPQTTGDEAAWVTFGGSAAHVLSGGTFTNIRVDGGPLQVAAGAELSGSGLQVGNGGRIGGGGGTLRAGGLFDWQTEGRMTGAGTTVSTGTMRIAAGSCWDALHLDAGHVFRTEGTGTYACGRIYGTGDGVWENTGDVALNATWPSRLMDEDGVPTTGPILRNLPGGTLRKTGGGDQTDVFWRVENDGRMREDTAHRLALHGGDGGVSDGNTGATLAAGAFRLGAGARADGLRVAGAIADVQAGTAMTSTGMHLESGTLGGAGTIDVTGTLRWTGGTMAGTGTTRVTGHLDVQAPSGWDSLYLQAGRTLRTEGTGAYRQGRLHGYRDAVWQNTGTVSMNFEWPSEMYEEAPDGTALPLVHNQAGGTFEKTAGGSHSNVHWAFENDGRTRETCTPPDGGTCSPGMLRLLSGGRPLASGETSTGNHGATLAGGVFPHGDGAKFDGAEITGGKVDLVAGARATSNGMRLSGGTLGGAGVLEVTGTFDWSGGAMADTGTTTVSGHLDVNAPSGWDSMYLQAGRTLRTEGTGTYRQGRLWGYSDAVWENAGTIDANFEWPSEMYEDAPDASRPEVHNLPGGVFRKVSGGSHTNVNWAFENDGTTTEPSSCTPPDGQSTCSVGQLRLLHGSRGTSDGTHGVTLVSGTFPHGDGARLSGAEIHGTADVAVAEGQKLTGGDFLMTGGRISGAGDVLVDGTMQWQGGEMTGPGTTRVTGHLAVDGADWTSVHIGQGRTLRTEGTGTWVRTRIHGRGGAVWENTGTFALNGEWPGYLVQDQAQDQAPPVLRNTGTMTKNGGTGSTDVHWPIENDGTFTQQAGSLRFHGGGEGRSGGAFGGTLAAGTYTLADGADLGSATVGHATVTIPAGAEARTSAGELHGGVIAGRGTLRVTGTLRWTGGTMQDPGHTVVAPGAKLTLAGNGYVNDHRILQAEGEMEIESGTLTLGEGTRLVNTGRFAMTGSYGGVGVGRRAEFVNRGTIVRDYGGEDPYSYASGSIDTLENDGTLLLLRGLLTVSTLNQTTDARIVNELGGTSNHEYGRLSVNGQLRMAGDLETRLRTGYVPATNATYNAISAPRWVRSGGEPLAAALTFGDGGSITGAWTTNGYSLSATVPAVKRAAAPEEEAPAPDEDEAAAPAAPAPAAPVSRTVRLTPGAQTAVALPAEGDVQVLTPTRRASVRLDARRRVLRIRLLRGAQGRQVRLRYRVVAADGRSSRVATITVRITRPAAR